MLIGNSEVGIMYEVKETKELAVLNSFLSRVPKREVNSLAVLACNYMEDYLQSQGVGNYLGAIKAVTDCYSGGFNKSVVKVVCEIFGCCTDGLLQIIFDFIDYITIDNECKVSVVDGLTLYALVRRYFSDCSHDVEDGLKVQPYMVARFFMLWFYHVYCVKGLCLAGVNIGMYGFSSCLAKERRVELSESLEVLCYYALQKCLDGIHPRVYLNKSEYAVYSKVCSKLSGDSSVVSYNELCSELTYSVKTVKRIVWELRICGILPVEEKNGSCSLLLCWKEENA